MIDEKIGIKLTVLECSTGVNTESSALMEYYMIMIILYNVHLITCYTIYSMCTKLCFRAIYTVLLCIELAIAIDRTACGPWV